MNSIHQSIPVDLDDPFLWLEKIDDEKSLDWVRARNKATEQNFAGHSNFKAIRDKILHVLDDKDNIAYPRIIGSFVYNFWQDEINERGLWRRMLLVDFVLKESNWETVLDLDELSKSEEKEWVFAGSIWLEPENNRCLIKLSDRGKDEVEIREFDALKKEFIKDGFFIPASKSSVTWEDSDTLLVATECGENSMTQAGYPRIVKRLSRLFSLSDAPTILEIDASLMGAFCWSFYANQERYNFITVGLSFHASEVHSVRGDDVRQLDFPRDAEVSGFHKGHLLLHLQREWLVDGSTYKAGSLVSYSLDAFFAGTTEVKLIFEPTEKCSFDSVSESKDFILLMTLDNVQSKAYKVTFEGGQWLSTDFDAPLFGTLSIISSSHDCNDCFLYFSNLLTPPTLFHSVGGALQEIKAQKHVIDPRDFTIHQLDAVSKDGTKVPYFMISSKKMQLNGENPTLVDAYGGFAISSLPVYMPQKGIGWLEQGGVYVLANIRGGGEFGPKWHQAALKEKRQNAYDDLFAVSEDLIRRKVSSPETMGVFGWSNGGLMAGVALTQRPDLYGAVVIGAPLLDMKRYSKLLAGSSWVGEYGDPDIPEEWDYIKKYSPYHNLDPEIKYPEPLFLTSTRDDRVHPGHARKMAAKMMDQGHSLFYFETIEGGHGASSTNKQQAHMAALLYSYLVYRLSGQSLRK